MKGVKKLHLFPILIKKRTAIVNFNGTRSASGALTLPLARFYGTPVGEDSLLVLLLFFVDRISGAKPEPFQIYFGSAAVQIPYLLGKLIVCVLAFFITQILEAYFYKRRTRKNPWTYNVRLDLTKKGRPAYKYFLAYSWFDGHYYVLPDRDGKGYVCVEVSKLQEWLVNIGLFSFIALLLINHSPSGKITVFEWVLILASPTLLRVISILLPKKWVYASPVNHTTVPMSLSQE